MELVGLPVLNPLGVINTKKNRGRGCARGKTKGTFPFLAG